MLIQCPICTELFTESNSVVGLQCGHLFHELCLTKWFENKCNCPQCRAKCKKTSVFKIYFSVGSSSNFSIIEQEEQSSHLNEELSLAKTSLKEKSLENSLLVAEKLRLQERIADLTVRLKQCEDRAKREESERKALQNELKTSMTSLGQTCRENTELKKKVETLGNVQLVINGCEEEIDTLVSNSTDIKQMATWCSVYRKELERKKMDLRLALDTTRRLRKEAESRRAKEDEDRARIKTLEDDDLNNKEVIASLEDKIKSLMKKLVTLQAAVDSPRNTTKSLVHRLLHESPAPMNMSCLNDSISTPVVPKPGNIPSKDGPIADEKENESSRKRKSSLEEEEKEEGQNDAIKIQPIDETPLKPQKKIKRSHETSKPAVIQNPILDLDIFKKHKLLLNNRTKSLAFTGSSASSTNQSDTMIMRKGYNGLGGHEKYVGPKLPRHNSIQSSAAPRRNLGPSTNSSQPSNRRLFPSLKIDDLF